MARLRRRATRALIAAGLLLALAPVPAAPALAGEASPAPGLHDRPVLVLDPGRHTAAIRRLDADRDGRLLVTASDDKTVRVWAAADGRLLRTLRLPAGPGNVGKAYAAAISPDGATVAAGGWTADPPADEGVYLFERAGGRLLHRIGGLPNRVLHLTFAPDGRTLAAALGSGGVRLLDPATGATLAADGEYGGGSYGAAFDPASRRLATTSLDGKVRLYALDGGPGGGPGLRPLKAAAAPGGGRPYGVAFSPDGARLAVGYDDAAAVDVLDAGTLERLLAADTKGVDNGDLSEVAWAADGALLAAGRWQVGGAYRVRRWPGGGRGAPADLALGGARDTVTGLRPLPGGRLAFAAADPRLGALGADGGVLWEAGPAGADFRGQRGVLAASADGARVRFGYGQGGEAPAVFALAERRLLPGGGGEGLAAAGTGAAGLAVEGWQNGDAPTLNGARLALLPHELSRSLAVAPDGRSFVLGTEWRLRAYGRDGRELWRRPAPGAAWAVAVSGDGRLAAAAYGDGTVRWHRMDDGTELLAFYPLADQTNWVAWTPEGFYAATPGAYGVLRWHVNRGRDEAADSIPVSDIRELRRPDVLPLVLQEMDVVRALGLAELGKARRAVQARTGSAVPPGAQLHVLAVGISGYNEERARQLRLDYAGKDARDVASALVNTQASLYADVKPTFLADDEATKPGIMDALAAMRERMAAGSGRDLAVVHFAGHGVKVDGRLYLLPYEVDARTPARIKASALSAEELRAELVELGKVGRVLVLLDACHSGAATADGARLAGDGGQLGRELAAGNVSVLTSSAGSEPSREDPAWGNGAFTKVLLEALGSVADGDRDGLVSVTELTDHLSREVPALTKGAQTPGIEVRYQGGLFAAGL